MSYHEQQPVPNPAGVQPNVSYQASQPVVELRQDQYYQQAQYPQTGAVQSWFDFQNSSYLKGFVVGAGIALVLANPTVQKALVSGAVKVWTGLQGGVEEIKEHVKDIKAEISTKE